jgi:hypothetical protein
MWSDRSYLALANAVLVLHVGVVLFVVGGLLLIVLGHWRRRRRPGTWRWVDAWWFRLAHLAAIGLVVAESWYGVVCPLTTLEAWLRVRAGAPVYGGSGFVEHWLQRLLYYDAPAWVFTLGYTLFALLVVWAWWRFPPRRGGGH